HDLAEMGAQLLVSTIDRLAEAPLTETPQNDSDATYARRLTKDDGIVDWSASAVDVHNLIRGLHSWPHAFTFLGANRVILLRSTMSNAPTDEPPGTIVEASSHRLLVATGVGTLQIDQLQPEGKRPMRTDEFLAGHHLPRGERFGTRPS